MAHVRVMATGFLLALVVYPARASSDDTERRGSASGLWDATDIPCTRAIERSTLLNGPQLFRAAEACAREDQSDDAVFLLWAGQVRAMVDIYLLEPRSGADRQAVGELYGAMYYTYGGSGPDELFRDAEKARRMFVRLSAWRPSFSDGYDPGWTYESPVEVGRYMLMVDHSKRSRLAKLETYRNLIQDDRYYAVQTERNEILARNDSRIVEGTEDASRIRELDQVAAALERSIPRVPEPTLPKELQPADGPDPDAEFRQLYVGFNAVDGEEGDGVIVVVSRTEALKSWLSRVMSSAELQGLLAKVDFERQSLVVARFPSTESANGKLYIRDIEIDDAWQSVDVRGVLGVNEEDCTEPKTGSYPFVVAATPKIAFEVQSVSWAVSTRAEGCRPAVGTDGTLDSTRAAETSGAVDRDG